MILCLSLKILNDTSERYLKKESSNLFINTELIFEKMVSDHSGNMQVCEDQALYEVRSARKPLE
jgi:hypothetical protein